MTVFEFHDAAGGLDPSHCDQVRQQSYSRIAGAEGIDGVRVLYVADTGASGLPSQEWVELQRCKLAVAGMDPVAVGKIKLPEFTAAIRKLRAADKADADGPVDGFRWRHNGVVIQEKLSPMAWRLVNHLFSCGANAADYAALAPIVNDDHEEAMLDYSNCRGLRDSANKYFRQHVIPWKVSLQGKPTLIPSK